MSVEVTGNPGGSKMQRLDTLKFALAGGIYGAGCVALATICTLLGIPGFKPFTDLLVAFTDIPSQLSGSRSVR